MTTQKEITEKVRVLYMDDDRGLARLFQKRLERLGYQVDLAPDGEEGLKMFAQHPCEVVAVDKEMPGLDGIEVVRELAALDDPPAIVMITGAGDEATAVEALKAGAQDYIAKDVDSRYIDLFASVMENALKNKRMLAEKRQAEKALRESERKYRTIMENANDCIVAIQSERIVFANSAFEKLFGSSHQEEEPLVFCEIVRSENHNCLVQIYEETIRGASPGPVEIKAQNRHGRELVMEIKFTPMQYEDRPAAMAVMRDITERKIMERKLLRTKKLESVGILAGGIAHDYNNILAAVLGYISLVEKLLDENDQALRMAREAEKAAMRGRDLTRKFLVFATGGDPVKKIVNLGPLLERLFSQTVRGHVQECEKDIARDLWPVEADEGHLTQALENLVENAKYAMPDKGYLRLSASNAELGPGNALSAPPGKYVLVSVEDRGGGMSEQMLENIFDPYFSTKKRGAQKGMGLGLSITYTVVKEHDGHISVKSKPGEGTVFDVYLPAWDELSGKDDKLQGEY